MSPLGECVGIALTLIAQLYYILVFYRNNDSLLCAKLAGELEDILWSSILCPPWHHLSSLAYLKEDLVSRLSGDSGERSCRFLALFSKFWWISWSTLWIGKDLKVTLNLRLSLFAPYWFDSLELILQWRSLYWGSVLLC